MPGMERRAFLALTGPVLTGAGLPLASTVTAAGDAGAAPTRQDRPGRPGRMKLGCQSGPTDEKRLQFFARHGVTHICAELPGPETRAPYTADELAAIRDLAAKQQIVVDMISLPFLKSSHIDATKRGAIMLGQSPERDRDIEDVQTAIRHCAAAGIPAIKYNMSLLGVLRTPRTPGRGGTRLSTWRLDEAGDLAKKETRAGRVPADLYWERITYFLERVIPVATEHKVRMALPSARSRRAAGLPGRRRRAGHRRRAEALRLDCREPVSRPELLPGHGLGDAEGPRARDPRGDPPTSGRARRSSTSTSATSAAVATASRRSIPTPATSTS